MSLNSSPNLFDPLLNIIEELINWTLSVCAVIVLDTVREPVMLVLPVIENTPPL